MRLFVAAFLCCFAAVNEDEFPIDKDVKTSKPAKQIDVCNKQPAAVAPPAVRVEEPRAAIVKHAKSLTEVGRSLDIRKTSSSPALRPSTSLRAGSLNSRGSSKDLFARQTTHDQRPSISSPNSFRRVDLSEAQRVSLVPLRLGPVVLRGLPDDPPAVPELRSIRTHTGHSRSDSAQELLQDSKCESGSTTRESSFLRGRQSTDRLASPAYSSTSSNGPPHISPEEKSLPRLASSGQSLSSSLHRQALESSLASLSSRAPVDAQWTARLKKKRSSQSFRRGMLDDNNIAALEKEVLELNTIVEERRAEALKAFSPDRHVSAVAPSMQIDARSETLNDIGSALSRPLTARDNHPRTTFLDDDLDLSDDAIERPSSADNSKNNFNYRATSRVSGWLSSLLPANVPQIPTSDPSYKYNAQNPASMPAQRPPSQVSCDSSTYMTELDSPTLTITSSSRASAYRSHRRSLTADSRFAASLLPHAMEYVHAPVSDAEQRKRYGLAHGHYNAEEWPVMVASEHRVGMAL